MMICPREKNIVQAKSVLATAIAAIQKGAVRRARSPSADTEGLIQVAHSSFESCSETHSRQKGRWQTGQRQTAPRWA
jgi:hypothetical protein